VATATAEEAASQAWLHRWQVAGVVRELVWSLRIAEAEQRLAQQALASARALQDDVERRLRAGELAHADLILAQKETLARELERTQAESRYQALRARYRAMTGLGELPPLAEETPAPAAGIDSGHPALAAATAATDRARAERDRVRNEKRDNPLLTVGAIQQRAEQRFDYEQSLVLELSMPLGLASQAEPRTAVAERDLTEASNALMRLRRELERDLIEASAERSRTEQTVRLADTRQQLAAEGLRLSRRAFELGEGDLFSLLQTRSQAIAAERERELQQLEHGRAVARYNQALGVLPQ
jgi:outer membrane protein TolC